MKPRPHSAATLAQQAAELGLAAQHVVSHRVARMALAGPMPSARDRHEFTGMVAEKRAAFGHAWLAMATQALLAGPAMAAVVFAGSTPASAWQAAAWNVLGNGLAPVHRKAVANAGRLARTRLR